MSALQPHWHPPDKRCWLRPSQSYRTKPPGGYLDRWPCYLCECLSHLIEVHVLCCNSKILSSGLISMIKDPTGVLSQIIQMDHGHCSIGQRCSKDKGWCRGIILGCPKEVHHFHVWTYNPTRKVSNRLRLPQGRDKDLPVVKRAHFMGLRGWCLIHSTCVYKC